jgi:glucokinase
MTSAALLDRLAFPVLVGDIGGTNARFALLADASSEPQPFPIVPTSAKPTLEDAIEHALSTSGAARPRSALLAVAGPVDGDEFALTNFPWLIRPRVMIERFGLEEVVILNDFEAQALAAAALGPDHLMPIGGGRADPDASRVILGPGTGLGVAGLVRALGRWIPVAGEGGHVDVGPRTPREYEIFPHIEPIEGRISAEQILCGRGLVNLYRAVVAARGGKPALSTPPEVTAAAEARSDADAVEALDLFVTCLGRVAGDLALVFMSRGGVFITGGIGQKIAWALQRPAFRAAFEDKAPHGAHLRQMPIYVITHPLAAIAGLSAFACNPERFGVSTRGRHWRR